MKKLLSLLLSIILIFSCAGVTSARQTGAEKKTYIVVLEAPAVYSPDRVTFYGADDDMYRQALIELQAEVRAQISGGASTYSLRNTERTYTYTDVLNGFTVNVDAATADEIKKIDGVKAVIENETISVIEPVGKEINYDVSSVTGFAGNTVTTPADISTGNMINTQTAYDKGYNGKGRAIAILDTAILPQHSYFNISDEATVRYTQADIEKIINKKGLNVGATAENAYYNPKIPFAYSYAENCTDISSGENHGAHVAGIAAGGKVMINNKFYISGIAPETQILFFGIFDKTTGTAAADTLIAAFEDAVKFGVDAINLSIGRPYRSENNDDVFSEIAKNAENAGISVVYAAGNEDKGDCVETFDIDYSTADNRSYLTTTKVGSVQNEYIDFEYLEDNLGNKYKCVSNGKSVAFDFIQIANCGKGSAGEINSADVSGKVAFITMPHKADSPEGIGTYYARAVAGGAKAVVIAINTNNDLSYGIVSSATCPILTVTERTGQFILDSGATSLKFANAKEILKSDEAGCVSYYSSYGYADNLDISIDFAAPGGNILSSVLSQNGYMYKSGTSMATPHITGATILMYQYVDTAFPTYTGTNKVRLIRKLLASTAKTVYDSDGVIASPRKVGAGLIDLQGAMSTSVYLTGVDSEYTRVNLGAGLTENFEVNFEVHNLGNAEVVFDAAQVELSSDDYYVTGNKIAFDGLRKLNATVTGGGNITVPANSKVQVSLEVTLSGDDIEYLSRVMTNGFFIDGKVTLTDSDNCDVGIPFSGFYGNWSKLPIMNEKRVLDYFSLMGFSADGFIPPAMILKENSQIVMPIANEVDESVAQIPVAVFANPIRNAFMTIRVDEKTVLNDAFINKFYDLGYYLENIKLGDLSDASVITVELRLPYDTQGASKQTFTINTVKDSSSPVISDVYASQKTDGDYAYLTVSDNYGVGAVTAKGEYGGKWYYSDAYIQKTSATAEFYITALDNLHYYVYDCAFNMTALAPHIGIDVNGGVATYTNTTHKKLSGVCLIALYGDGNKMTYFGQLSDGDITIDAYDTAGFDVSAYKGKNYKLFFWSDLQSVTPICDNFETK